MKKILPAVALVMGLCTFTACSSDPKQEKQEQKAVEEQVQQDQQAMDSLEKAIEAQINGVSEDSLMKVDH